MKKTAFFILICFLFVYCGGGSGGGKYAEVKDLLKEYMVATTDYVKAMESAADGKAVAKAMIEYGKKMKDLEPKLDEMQDKYPELGEEEPPAELKDLMAEFGNIEQHLEPAMKKMMEYMTDPDVLEAIEKMGDM